MLSVFLIAFSLTIYNNNINNVFATTDDTKNKDDDGNQDKFKINVNINLNNIKQENPQLFKVVAFVNGDIQTKTVDLKKNATISKNGLITTPFELSKENNVSQIDTGDEYFVCGYLLKPDTNGEQQKNTNFNNKTILYDCNEGRLASVDKDSTTLFSTLNKFNTSVSMHQSAVNTTPQSSKEVKIIL